MLAEFTERPTESHSFMITVFVLCLALALLIGAISEISAGYLVYIRLMSEY